MKCSLFIICHAVQIKRDPKLTEQKVSYVLNLYYANYRKIYLDSVSAFRPVSEHFYCVSEKISCHVCFLFI